ncbi:PPOX class F420-dependent oxidoreductase [Frankia sp. AiPs1]|uniref:PPOX class F420-dependent oxidoreductase n=1 Tax=Frankia sp. AiPs1 TaxID=573493 RepID=UPI0020444A1B|nr:PPOX class F420-dependent oxidoreductase [Frankia sp. AiPs1]MCM3922982.1 PPOX class F420-dependent oxidoreductase [Frankia sp. AiPs1]
MTLIPETHRDLAQNAEVAILTTLGPDGAPQTTAVGYLLDDGVFRISVSSDKQKLKNLQRTPQVSLFLLDITNVYRTVEVRGTAEVILDDDYTFAAKIAESRGRTADDIRKLTPPGEHRYCIAVTPAKINTFG